MMSTLTTIPIQGNIFLVNNDIPFSCGIASRTETDILEKQFIHNLYNYIYILDIL